MPIEILAPPRAVYCGAILRVARLHSARVGGRSDSSATRRCLGDSHCYMHRSKAGRDMAAVPLSQLLLRIPARPTYIGVRTSDVCSHVCAVSPPQLGLGAHTLTKLTRATTCPARYELWPAATSGDWATTASTIRLTINLQVLSTRGQTPLHLLSNMDQQPLLTSDPTPRSHGAPFTLTTPSDWLSYD